jgi:hypothetical protein
MEAKSATPTGKKDSLTTGDSGKIQEPFMVVVMVSGMIKAEIYLGTCVEHH